MASIRGRLIRGQDRGYRHGRGQGRRRGCGVQVDRAKLVELSNISTRSRAFPREFTLSSASVSNERTDMQNARVAL